MKVRPYKFVVVAVVQQVDDEAQVVGESEAQPIAVYGCDALIEWAKSFPDRLAESGGS